jgi:hypothetical protein
MRRKNRNLFSEAGHKRRLIDKSIPIPIVTMDSIDPLLLAKSRREKSHSYPALVSSLILLVHGREVEGSILTGAIRGSLSSQLPTPVRAPEYLHHTRGGREKMLLEKIAQKKLSQKNQGLSDQDHNNQGRFVRKIGTYSLGRIVL